MTIPDHQYNIYTVANLTAKNFSVEKVIRGKVTAILAGIILLNGLEDGTNEFIQAIPIGTYAIHSKQSNSTIDKA